MSSTPQRGKFIVFEGLDGVGKTTLATAYARHLSSKGHLCIYTREPGGTAVQFEDNPTSPALTSPMAEELRDVILRDRSEHVTTLTELLVMYAARAQHLNEVIIPTLEQGIHVICDRFTLTTYLYQVFGNHPDLGGLNDHLKDAVVGNARPDLTVGLHAPFSVVTERFELRDATDRLDVLDQRRFESLQNEMLENLPPGSVAYDTSVWADSHDILHGIDVALSV